MLNFALRNGYGNFQVIVEEIGDDNNSVIKTDTLFECSAESDTWKFYEFPLNVYTGKKVRIGFVAIVTKRQNKYIYFDNIY